VKILNLESKDLKDFGIGLARENFSIQKNVGSEKSMGIRGDGKIYYQGAEEPINLASRLNIDLR
jgi:hypothetical protein